MPFKSEHNRSSLLSAIMNNRSSTTIKVQRLVSLIAKLIAILFIIHVDRHHCQSTPAIMQITSSQRIVKTKYGSVRGSLINFTNKSFQPIESFLGIPYASPPVAKLRFMPPVTPAIWQGIRNVNTFGPVCPQRFPNIENQTEIL